MSVLIGLIFVIINTIQHFSHHFNELHYTTPLTKVIIHCHFLFDFVVRVKKFVLYTFACFPFDFHMQ